MNKKIIVIGSGVSGLSIAARLLSKGFDVTVLEKNSTVGGKTNHFEIDGFKFNLTASIMMFFKDYIEIFKYCNEDYKNYFSIMPIKDLYRVFYKDKKFFDFSSDFFKLIKTLNEITDKDVKETYSYFNFLCDNYKKYHIANEHFLNKAFIYKGEFFKSIIKDIKFDFSILPSCYKESKSYIKNKKLLDYIMFQSMYIGVSPYTSSNIYNVIPSVTQIESLYYIEGGMYSYIKALKNLILKQGGIIKTNYEVDKILFNDNKAFGVVINNNSNEILKGDAIVCSADYSYAIKDLITDTNIQSLVKPIEKYKYSCSTFILYLGLNKKYPTLKLNNIYINKKFKKNLQAPFKGSFSKDPSLYIYCPSSIDETICPKGCESINVILRVPNLLNENIHWNSKLIKKLKNNIITILSSIDSLSDIKEHIIIEKFLTPLDLKYKFNSYGGTAFGLSHTLKQTNIFRPQCSINGVENLFFTGASTHPGNGVSMVIKSSKICSDEICKVYN